MPKVKIQGYGGYPGLCHPGTGLSAHSLPSWYSGGTGGMYIVSLVHRRLSILVHVYYTYMIMT